MIGRAQRFFYLRGFRPKNALENPGAPCVMRRLVEFAEGDSTEAEALAGAGWVEVADAAALEAVV